MNLYIENKSYSFFKKAFVAVTKNVNKDADKVFIIEYKGRFSSPAYRFARRQGVYNIEHIIFGERGLARAVHYLNRRKSPISLTIVLKKPLSKRGQKKLLCAKKEFKIIDLSNQEANFAFCQTCQMALYKSATVDQILDADIMHLYKFFETVFQCKFSSCLGEHFYVTKKGTVHFCPMHLNESEVGHIDGEGHYLNHEHFRATLDQAIEKRTICQNECQYYEYCAGGCPMEEGCCDFPALFERNAGEIDRIIQEGESLDGKKIAIAKIVVKDAVYFEEKDD